MGFRKALRKFIERLGEAGEREFGGRAPSCCDGKPAGERKAPRNRVAEKKDTK